MSAPVPSSSSSSSAGKKPRNAVRRVHPTPVEIDGLPKILSSQQVSDYIGINDTSFAELRARGQGPRYIKIGNKVRYYASDVEAWLAANVVETDDQKAAAR